MLFADLSSAAIELVDLLLNRYEHATLSDFTYLGLAVIISCWFVSKYARD